MYMDSGKCKETCGGDSCLYDRSVIIMLLSAVVYNVFFCGKEGRKKSHNDVVCKYFVHCQFGSMIEGFGLLGVGFKGRESCPSFPTQRVCLFVIIIGLVGLYRNDGILLIFRCGIFFLVHFLMWVAHDQNSTCGTNCYLFITSLI